MNEETEIPDGSIYQAFSERMLHKQRRLDLFAAAALQGLIAHGPLCGEKYFAQQAWEFAKAMIEQEPK